MKSWLLGTYFFLTSLLVFADSPPPQSVLDQGIQAYQKNDFEKALNLFESLNQNIGSAGLFGYIGNCHIKMNRLGQGIAAYLSALKRDPNNPDLRHNLQYALSQTPDQIDFANEIRGLRDLFLSTVRLASVSTHRTIFCVLFLLLILTCAWYGIYKDALLEGRLWISLFTVILILQGAALVIRVNDMEQKQGVVIVPETKVRYGPSDTDTEAFLLHAGSPFEIHHREGGWAQIRLRDGKTGWLPKEAFVDVK